MIDEKRFKLIDSKTGKEFEFDGLTGSMGPDVINISSLYKQTGLLLMIQVLLQLQLVIQK